MTSLASIIVLLAIAAAGAWAWMHDRARKLAEKRAREERERLVAERWVAHEIALAEAEVYRNARLQVDAEEKIRKEAETKEEAWLAEEHRLAAQRQAAQAQRQAEAQAQRQAEEAQAQAREEARLKTLAEAEAQAQRQAEEAQAQAREEARLKTLAEAEAQAQRQAEEAQAQAREEARLKTLAEAEAQAQRQAEEAQAQAREEARLKTLAEAEAQAQRQAEEAQAQAREEARLKTLAEAEAQAQRQAEEAQAQAREEARLKTLAEAEAQAQRQAEEAQAQAREEARLKTLAEAEAQAQRQAEEAQAQAREEARLKTLAEAEAQAQRQAEEAQAQAREEARLKTLAEAEAQAQRQAEEAQAQAREEARLKTLAEAEAQAQRQAEEAQAQAREEARLKTLAEAEAQAQRQAEEAQAQAREEARLKTLAEAEAQAQRQAEEAQAQAREEARLKTLAEAEAQAQRQAEEAQAQAREEARLKAEAEESERARIAAEEAMRRQAEKKAERKKKARDFLAPKASPVSNISSESEPNLDNTPRENVSSPIRLQLVFGRGSTVRTLALVPHRRDGMPNNLEVTTTNGVLQLAEWSEDAYQPIPVSEFPGSLSEGLVWQAREGDQRWRWELTRRELYVLAAGDEFGLHGFVTRRYDQRLWLNTRHVVLAKEDLREPVIAALAEAGCQPPVICDATTPGVSSGWILIREVIPTRAVPMREERDPLNVLCPAHEIEPRFVGGIRLERNAWLAGFAPRIRFNGELVDGFEVLIDSHQAQLAADGSFEAPGWDQEGEHRLWYAGQAVTYVLRAMQEEWDYWQAYDLGTGAAICGATTHWLDGAHWRQVCIPAANPLLVGSRPGEIFYCQPRTDVRSETILTLVPFAPVWALPLEPVHADKRYVRLVSLELLEPATAAEPTKRSPQMSDAIRRWVTAINDAGRKQLALSAESDATKALWRRYRAIAKQLWKQGSKRR